MYLIRLIILGNLKKHEIVEKGAVEMGAMFSEVVESEMGFKDIETSTYWILNQSFFAFKLRVDDLGILKILSTSSFMLVNVGELLDNCVDSF